MEATQEGQLAEHLGTHSHRRVLTPRVYSLVDFCVGVRSPMKIVESGTFKAEGWVRRRRRGEEAWQLCEKGEADEYNEREQLDPCRLLSLVRRLSSLPPHARVAAESHTRTPERLETDSWSSKTASSCLCEPPAAEKHVEDVFCRHLLPEPC